MSPSHDSGLVVRIVAGDDGFAKVEVWDFPTKSWVQGDPELLAKAPRWPPALPHVLERLGVAREDWDERL